MHGLETIKALNAVVKSVPVTIKAKDKETICPIAEPFRPGHGPLKG